METFRGTTIVAVKRDGHTAIAGDGQVTMGEHVIMKGNAVKVRRIFNDKVVIGFAGSVSDAFALSARFEDTTIIKDFSALTAPKTKEFVKIIDTLKLTGKILIIADTKLQENQHLELAARNLPNVRIILPSNINVKDILEADSVVMSEASVAEITERLMK